jgi:hypothetical protein
LPATFGEANPRSWRSAENLIQNLRLAQNSIQKLRWGIFHMNCDFVTPFVDSATPHVDIDYLLRSTFCG